MKQVLSLAALVLGLSACGAIPTPEVSVPDSTIPLAASMAASPGKVVYAERNGLPQTVPAALKNLTLRGDATYDRLGGTLTTLNLYVRTSLTDLTGCTVVPATPVTPRLFVCDAAAEAAQRIGTLNLQAGVAVPFELSGAALDAAAHAGSGYFGMEVVAGSPMDGETVKLSNVKAQAKI